MADFKVIETQEAFDEAVKERLARKDKEMSEKYKGYLSPDDVSKMKEEYEKRLADATTLVNDAKVKLANHDKEVSDLRASSSKTRSHTKRAYRLNWQAG